MIRLVGAALLMSVGVAAQAEWRGYVGAQVRVFPDTALDARQADESLSWVVQPEWYQQFNGGDDSLNVKLFYRHDNSDQARRHGDIREAYWQHVGADYEFTLGINKVFWGVTESQHLVDIINQTDLVEAPDGEEKLGQPMAHLALLRDWGVVDVFVLPGFRERTFPGAEGRLRSHPRTVESADYASGAGDDHIDVALRWSHYLGDVSLGVSVFRGTSREPQLAVATRGGEIVLQPFYSQIQQSGLDAQYVSGDWLWKLEAIYREHLEIRDSLGDQNRDFAATTAGFEKNQVGVLGSDWDLGWIAEYSYDGRDQGLTLFQNDLFVGARLTFNDIAGSEVLLGVAQDLDSESSRLAYVEGSTRLGAATRFSLEVNYFNSDEPQDALHLLRQDSFIELALEYYF